MRSGEHPRTHLAGYSGIPPMPMAAMANSLDDGHVCLTNNAAEQYDGEQAPAVHTYLLDRNSGEVTVEFYTRAATHTRTGTCQLDK